MDRASFVPSTCTRPSLSSPPLASTETTMRVRACVYVDAVITIQEEEGRANDADSKRSQERPFYASALSVRSTPPTTLRSDILYDKISHDVAMYTVFAPPAPELWLPQQAVGIGMAPCMHIHYAVHIFLNTRDKGETPPRPPKRPHYVRCVSLRPPPLARRPYHNPLYNSCTDLRTSLTVAGAVSKHRGRPPLGPPPRDSSARAPAEGGSRQQR